MTKKTEEGGDHAPLADNKAFGPLRQEYTLRSGRSVIFEMPDLFAFANGQTQIPNSAQLDVYELLYGSSSEEPKQKLISDQQYMRSLFYTTQLVTVPRVRLEDEEEGEIDRRELALSDLLAAFSFLRYGPTRPIPTAENTDTDAPQEPA